MRGIDYRSSEVAITLVIAKSFENQCEAMQGFSRVGRREDLCKRVKFSEVPLVDKKQEAIYNAKLMKFISETQKNPMVLKQIVVKAAAVPKSKSQKQLMYNGDTNLTTKSWHQISSNYHSRRKGNDN
jgi:hypothetical protein